MKNLKQFISPGLFPVALIPLVQLPLVLLPETGHHHLLYNKYKTSSHGKVNQMTNTITTSYTLTGSSVFAFSEGPQYAYG